MSAPCTASTAGGFGASGVLCLKATESGFVTVMEGMPCINRGAFF